MLKKRMTKKTEKLARKYFLDQQIRGFTFLHKEVPTKQFKIEVLDQFEKKLNDNNTYTSFDIVKDQVRKFIIASKYNCPFEGRIINCWYLSFNEENQKKEGLEEIKRINKFFKNKSRSIKVTIFHKDLTGLDNLMACKFSISAYKLIGHVTTSLKIIRKKNIELADGFKFIKPLKKDINEIMKIEIDVHKKDVSSVANYNKKTISEMKKFMGLMIEKNNLNAVIDSEGNIIAHIGMLLNGRIGHIATIAVSEHYQGQGLSYVLYEKLLSEMLNQGIKAYTGYTATERVLAQAKIIKRRPFLFTLTLSPGQF